MFADSMNKPPPPPVVAASSLSDSSDDDSDSGSSSSDSGDSSDDDDDVKSDADGGAGTMPDLTPSTEKEVRLISRVFKLLTQRIVFATFVVELICSCVPLVI